MVDGREIWRQLLRVDEPWSVLEFEADPVRRSYQIVVGLETTRGWFGNAQKTAAPGFEKIWRHVNFGDWDIIVHVMAPSGSNLSGLPWAGQPGLPFSNLLCHQVFELLRDGMTTQSVAEHLRLPHDELWRFQHAVEGGRWLPPLKRGQGGHPDEDLPEPTSPVWLRVLEGTREIDVKLLSLKLMLTKLRAQLSSDTSETARIVIVQELYDYVARNKRSLEYEIAQLRENG